ncbi:MAG: hypothetical protein PHC85_01030 [Candidatus Pacebacteria bacterium]|nr:hypothetical protein [Candidatus Paceibacterota bacterium]
MKIPDIAICEKVIKNLKELEAKNGIFTCSPEKAAAREQRRDFLFGIPQPSELTTPARAALFFLIQELGLKPLFNVRNGYSGPADFKNLLDEAEKTISLFK